MKSETITQREDLIIRRHILKPGEALPWHTDFCHRFSEVIIFFINEPGMEPQPEAEVSK